MRDYELSDPETTTVGLVKFQYLLLGLVGVGYPTLGWFDWRTLEKFSHVLATRVSTFLVSQGVARPGPCERARDTRVFTRVGSRTIHLLVQLSDGAFRLANRSVLALSSIAIWLILPVVICLSQRLSHACLSTVFCTAKPRMAH